MEIQRRTLYVDGMTCPACEAKVSKSLLGLPGVLRAEAKLRGGKVELEYDGSLVDLPAMKAAIEKAGYALREREEGGTALALGIGFLLAAAYLVASASGAFRSLPRVDASIGYAMLFIVGLLTSIHCVAMCGGIALSQSLDGLAVKAALPSAGSLSRLGPGLLYNAGRVLSYTAVGGIVGALGSVFDFSPRLQGLIAGAAGLLMLVLGLKMLGLIRGLPRLSSLFPSAASKTEAGIVSRFRKGGPFAVGLLNGLMPCGPLQTMQLYALGTGSLLAGAFAMFLFSLGTVPLMLLFSLTAALLPRKVLPLMVKASAVLVILLGVLTFGRAASLAGLSLPSPPSLSRGSGDPSPEATEPGLAARVSLQGELPRAKLEGGVQTLVTEFKGGYYVPFVVQAGVPLRWTIRIKAKDLNGCNNPLVVPAYGIRKELVAGDNLVEFTPTKAGTIAYSCWMGMIRSKITVVSDLKNATRSDLDSPELSAIPDQGGGSCCGLAPAFSLGASSSASASATTALEAAARSD